MKKSRRKFSAAFKARVAIAALMERETLQPAIYRTGNVEFQQFFTQQSKHIIDKIDQIIAIHYVLLRKSWIASSIMVLSTGWGGN